MKNSSIETLDIERFTYNSFDENLHEIQQVYEQFERLGVPTVPSSRINSYRAAFESLKRAAAEERRLDLSLAEMMLHATVELAQLKTIIKAATAATERTAWDEQLRRLISGMSIPTPGSKHSPAHDFQFETFLAAVAELSGYKVSFDEPDVVVRDGTRVFGIAAKRPRSKRRIEKNCRKAANQIRQSGLPGIVALDVSFALYPNQCVNTNDLSGGLLFVQAAVSNFLKSYYHDLADACRDDGALGVLACLHLPVLNFGHDPPPQLASAMRWLVAPYCDPGDERLRWIIDFAENCELGLFGPRSKPEDFNLVSIHLREVE
jgi:hypothetical protein